MWKLVFTAEVTKSLVMCMAIFRRFSPSPFSTMHTTRAVKSTLVGWLKRLREPVQ